jgi:hypothetical protein
MRDAQVFEARRRGVRLPMDQLELVSGTQDQRPRALRADTEPVDPGRGRHRAIGLHRDLEATPVQGADQGCIELEQRKATILTGGLAAGGWVLHATYEAYRLVPESLATTAFSAGAGLVLLLMAVFYGMRCSGGPKG